MSAITPGANEDAEIQNIINGIQPIGVQNDQISGILKFLAYLDSTYYQDRVIEVISGESAKLVIKYFNFFHLDIYVFFFLKI